MKNEVLFSWSKKCADTNVYPDGLLLQEEDLLIKEWLINSDLTDFSACNGWLKKLE